MTYKINGKYYELTNEDAAEIRNNMKEFNISENDAARMFFEDWEYIPAGSKIQIERVPDLKVKKEYAKSDKPRNAKPRERKIDAEKGAILDAIAAALESYGVDITARKTETEISFSADGNAYTLKLTKHRPPKK